MADGAESSDDRNLEAMYKAAYDQAALSISSQEKSLTALQGRAKDLLGFATLTTTLVSSLGKLTNGKPILFNTQYKALLALTFGMVVVSSFIALRPRGGWAFTIDSAHTRKLIESDTEPYEDMTDLYKHGAETLDAVWHKNNDKIHGVWGVAPATVFLVVALAAEIVVIIAATFDSIG